MVVHHRYTGEKHRRRMACVYRGKEKEVDVNLPKTNEAFQKLLTSALVRVCAVVREGVYTGDAADAYITYDYFRRGAMWANDRPTASVWQCYVTLWVRKGVDAFPLREEIVRAIVEMGGTHPTEEIETNGAYKEYSYSFAFGGGI